MTSQRITLKIDKITAQQPISRWRLEAALHQELSKLIAQPGSREKLTQSRILDRQNNTVLQPPQSRVSSLSPQIARAVIGVLKS